MPQRTTFASTAVGSTCSGHGSVYVCQTHRRHYDNGVAISIQSARVLGAQGGLHPKPEALWALESACSCLACLHWGGRTRHIAAGGQHPLQPSPARQGCLHACDGVYVKAYS